MAMLTDPLNLIFIAIAAFAGFRLWRILGHRTESKSAPPQQEFNTQPKQTDLELKAIAAPPRNTWQGHAAEGSTLAKTLEDLADQDLQFDSNVFMERARLDHEKILNAFAAGDLEALKPLLTPETLSAFETEIARRKTTGETSLFKFVAIKESKIVDVRKKENLAQIDVAFTSSVFSALKSGLGKIIAGNEKRVAEIRELWSFERPLNVPSAIWRLAETHELPDNA